MLCCGSTLISAFRSTHPASRPFPPALGELRIVLSRALIVIMWCCRYCCCGVFDVNPVTTSMQSYKLTARCWWTKAVLPKQRVNNITVVIITKYKVRRSTEVVHTLERRAHLHPYKNLTHSRCYTYLYTYSEPIHKLYAPPKRALLHTAEMQYRKVPGTWYRCINRSINHQYIRSRTLYPIDPYIREAPYNLKQTIIWATPTPHTSYY